MSQASCRATLASTYGLMQNAVLWRDSSTSLDRKHAARSCRPDIMGFTRVRFHNATLMQFSRYLSTSGSPRLLPAIRPRKQLRYNLVRTELAWVRQRRRCQRATMGSCMSRSRYVGYDVFDAPHQKLTLSIALSRPRAPKTKPSLGPINVA